MQVSVETLDGLERKLTISIPAEKVAEQVDSRLKKLTRTAKIDGFRPGRAPLSVVKKRYLHDVYADVASELMRETLFDAIKNEDLSPAGTPEVSPNLIEDGKPFVYDAFFEIYPAIEINEFEQDKIEIIKSELTEQDLDNMIEKIREHNKDWIKTERPVAQGDKVVVDFEGYLGEEKFEGGSAEKQELIIGEGKMIPGFEEGIIGAELGKTFDLNVTFPEDYGSEELKGKDAKFVVTVHEIYEGELPKLDAKFVEKFNVKKGGVAAFKKDIKENMARQLEQEINSKNKKAVFDKLVERNTIEIPKSLVENEILSMKKDFYRRVFGNNKVDEKMLNSFPSEMFEEDAARRVRLGLLFVEYVDKHKLKADKEKVDAMIEKLAASYENPEELRNSYYQSKERLAEIESLVLEEMVTSKLLENAEIVEKNLDYDTVVNSKADEKK